jgi:hypothetical protein
MKEAESRTGGASLSVTSKMSNIAMEKKAKFAKLKWKSTTPLIVVGPRNNEN